MVAILIPPAYANEEFVTQEPHCTGILNSLIVPRPIAFVTTKGSNGVINAAPFSYFNIACTEPAIISIAIEHRDGMRKDTARNILLSKEFVINICSHDIAHAVNFASGDFSAEISEIELTKLSLLPSHKISVPRIANTLAQIECRLNQIVNLGDKPAELILGDVVKIHLHQDLLSHNDRIDFSKLNPLARLGGSSYAKLSDFFDLARN